MKRRRISGPCARRKRPPVSLKLNLTSHADMDSPVGALKTYVDALHSFDAQIIQAVRQGDLPTIRRILDRYPELANASTDLQQRERPSDTFAMHLTHLAVA